MRRSRRKLGCGVCLAMILASGVTAETPEPRPSADAVATDPAGREPDPSPYATRTPSRDGTGRFYMGREIAHVMGHRGADWLERPTRTREERTDLLVERLPLEADDVVVDLGAGTGYFSFPIARRLSRGRVLAVDLQPEMLDRLRRGALRLGLDNVETIQATELDPRIPAETADVVLIVDAYHEFSHPLEVGRGIFQGLRQGGKLYLVEYRGEDPRVPIKRLHKMTVDQAIREIEAIGLEWQETLDFLPVQHVIVFQKPRGDQAGHIEGRDESPPHRDDSSVGAAKLHIVVDAARRISQ